MGPRLEPGAPETKGEKLPHTAPRECGRHPAEAKMTLQVKDKHTHLCSTQKFSNTNKDVGLSLKTNPKSKKEGGGGESAAAAWTAGASQRDTGTSSWGAKARCAKVAGQRQGQGTPWGHRREGLRRRSGTSWKPPVPGLCGRRMRTGGRTRT